MPKLDCHKSAYSSTHCQSIHDSISTDSPWPTTDRQPYVLKYPLSELFDCPRSTTDAVVADVAAVVMNNILKYKKLGNV